MRSKLNIRGYSGGVTDPICIKVVYIEMTERSNVYDCLGGSA
jgi:hypothetical protein